MPFDPNAPIDVAEVAAQPVAFDPSAPIEVRKTQATFAPEEEVEEAPQAAPEPGFFDGYKGPMTTGQALAPGGKGPSLEDFIVKSDVDPDELYRKAKNPGTRARAMFLKFFGSNAGIRHEYEPTPMLGSEAAGTTGGRIPGTDFTLTVPKMQGDGKTAGVINAINKFTTGMTSPENVALLVGTEGLGAVADILPATRAAMTARIAQAGAMGTFGAQGVHDTAAAIQQFVSVMGDPKATDADKADALATALLSAGMAGFGAHGAKSSLEHVGVKPQERKVYWPKDESVVAEANRAFAEKPPATETPATETPATEDAPEVPLAALDKLLDEHQAGKTAEASEAEPSSSEAPPIKKEDYLDQEAIDKLLAEHTEPAAKAEEAPAEQPAPEYQYTVQRPQKSGDGKEVPGYIQIDEIRNGENTRSSNLEDLRKEGVDLPDVPDSLPQGRYTLDEIKAAAAKEAEFKPTDVVLKAEETAPPAPKEFKADEVVEPAPAAPATEHQTETSELTGGLVSFKIPGLSGSRVVAGKVTREMPGGKVEVRTQNDGYHVVLKGDLLSKEGPIPVTAGAKYKALTGGGSRVRAQEIVNAMTDTEATNAHKRMSEAEPGSDDHSEMSLQVLEERVEKIKDNAGVIARTAPKPRADIDNGTLYTEWRVRKVTTEDLQANSHLREKASVGDFVVERRNVRTEGENKQPGKWEPMDAATTKKGAIEAAWEPSMMKAESLDSTHKLVVDADQAKLSAKAEKARAEEKEKADNKAKQEEYIASVKTTALPKGVKREITLNLPAKDGQPQSKKVEATVYGDWSIHKDEKSTQGKYVVTHVPSGKRAQAKATIAEAKETIQAFIHSKADVSKPTIQTDQGVMNTLIQALNGLDRTREKAPDWFKSKEAPKAPEEGKSVGKNAAGQEIFELSDGKRYVMEGKDRNYGRDLSTVEESPPAPTAPTERPPVSSMSDAEKLAELKAGGIESHNGKPVEELNRAGLSLAVGKLRAGEKAPEVKADTPKGKEPKAEEPPAVEQTAPSVEKSAAVEPPTPPPEPPAAPKAPAPAPEKGGPISIKNEAIDREIRAMGLEPGTHGEQLKFEQAREQAAATMAKDPNAGVRLVEELEKNHRPIDGLEDALLLHELNNRRIERDAAENNFLEASESGDAARKADAKIRVNKAADSFRRAAEVADKVGTKNAQGLALRRMMMKEDFSLAAVERRARIANDGEPLNEVQSAKVRELVDRVAKAEKDLSDYRRVAEERLTNVEAENALLRFIDERKKAPKEKKATALDFISAQAAAARERIATRRKEGRIQSNIDPLAIGDHLIIGAEYLAKGITKAAEWSAAMIKELGPLTKEQLESIREKAERMVASMHESEKGGPRARPPVAEVLKENMKAGASLDDSKAYVQKLAEEFIRNGVHGRDALLDAVHGVLKEIDPEITKRQTMDAISGYGDFRKLNPDEVKAELRDLKGQMQQVAKLEDLQRGQAPAKTGVERRVPSTEERALIKQVEEAKRKAGIVTTDPATQLKTTLESIKTRLRNQIEDLTRQIESGKRDVENKTPTPRDAETIALREKRDALQAKFDEVFEKPGITDAQRIQRASKLYDTQIAELERQLRTNELFPKGKTDPKTPLTPELEAKRARIDALKAERDFARHLVQPRPEPAGKPVPKTMEERRIAVLDRMIARIEEQLKNEAPFSPGKKEPFSTAATKGREAQLKRLQEQRQNLRDRLQPPADIKSDAEIALAEYKARTTKKIAELQDKLAKKDFGPKPKKAEIAMDPEARALQSKAEMAKIDVENAIQKFEYDSLSPVRKRARDALATYDAARAILTTGELSFMLRQGKYLLAREALTHPIRTAKLMPDVFRALLSNKADAHAINLKTLNDPEAHAARQSGLYLAEHTGKLSKNEETFMGRLVGKIPVVRNLEQASTTFLNSLRLAAWKEMAAVDGLLPAEKKQIAMFVNEASGRGGLGSLEPAAVVLSRVMFSPRFFASRLQYMLGHSMWEGTGRSRGIIAKEYAKTVVAMGMYYTLLHAALGGNEEEGEDGSHVVLDPRSSDFGKIKIGNTRLDPLAGLAQMATFMTRTMLAASNATGLTDIPEVVSSRGNPVRISGPDVPPGGERWSNVAWRFARSKLHPVPGAIVNLFDRTDLAGNKADLRNQALNFAAPITYKDIYQALQERNLGDGVTLSLLAMLGEGLQTYGAEDTAVQSTFDRVRKYNDAHGVKPRAGTGVSDYTEFNKALAAKDDDAKAAALQKLIETKAQQLPGNASDRAKNAQAKKAVMDYYRQQAFSPFTGNLAKERAFKQTLDAKGLEDYAAAREERKQTFRTVQGLLRQQ